MSTTETALTAHPVHPGVDLDDLQGDSCDALRHRFRIAHATIQVEERGRCALRSDDVV